MTDALTLDDITFIQESLRYTRRAFEEYKYPSEEYRKTRIAELNVVVEKLKTLKREMKS